MARIGEENRCGFETTPTRTSSSSSRSGMARVDAVEEPGGIIITSGGYAEPVRIEFLNASERGMIDPGVVSAPAR